MSDLLQRIDAHLIQCHRDDDDSERLLVEVKAEIARLDHEMNATREAARAREAMLRAEVERRGNLVELAYGEGVLDASSRNATLKNVDERYETADAHVCLIDEGYHRQEFPDNYDDAMSRAALNGESGNG